MAFDDWFVLYRLGFFPVLAAGVTGILLVLVGRAVQRAEPIGLLLGRLEWLFPLRGRWLRRGVGAALIVAGLGLIVYTLPDALRNRHSCRSRRGVLESVSRRWNRRLDSLAQSGRR